MNKKSKSFNLLKLTLLLILITIHSLVCRKADFLQRILWYDKPAAYFEEALPLGNGRIGATVFGSIPSEHILLNEETLWAGGPVDPNMNPEAYIHLPAVREALKTGDYPLADKLVRSLQGKFSESYAPLGDLYIDFYHEEEVNHYFRELDLRTGIAAIKYQIKDISYIREMFVSFPDQLLVIKLGASKQGKINFDLRTSSLLNHNVYSESDQLVMEGQAPVHAEPNYRGDMPDAIVYDEKKGMRFIVIVKVILSNGTLENISSGLRVKDADEANLLISIATSFNGFDKEPGTQGRDESKLAAQILEKSSRKNYEELRTNHIKDFSSYFNRVSLDLGNNPAPEYPTDKRLEQYSKGNKDNDLEALYFQYGRYLLISSSRPGGIPANLQGIWNPHMRPPWSSNYTTNINMEMNYWAAEVTNLSEMHLPLLRFIGSLAETGRVTARSFFGARGWCCCHNTDIWAMTNPVGDFGKGHPCWANWNMAGTWLCTHLWEHYDFTQDMVFLKEYAYPLMKGAALFCLDWLIEDENGFLITSPSTSPENLYKTPEGYVGATSVGTTADIAMIRELFDLTDRAAQILKTDENFRNRLNQAKDKLLAFQIGKKGNLQEWYLDWEDADPKHRHVSHLFGLYPGRQISPLSTPELSEACRRSLELRGDGGTGWSKAWKINLWARLLEGNHAHKMLQTHLNYVEPNPEIVYSGGGTYPNLWDAHPPFQIDGNFGGTAGIAEMLLQSHTGEIHLLPALPFAWKDGYIRGLCARGGFVVDMTWENHKLLAAVIRSKIKGSAIIRYQDKTITLDVDPGKRIKLDWELTIR